MADKSSEELLGHDDTAIFAPETTEARIQHVCHSFARLTRKGNYPKPSRGGLRATVNPEKPYRNA